MSPATGETCRKNKLWRKELTRMLSYNDDCVIAVMKCIWSIVATLRTSFLSGSSHPLDCRD